MEGERKIWVREKRGEEKRGEERRREGYRKGGRFNVKSEGVKFKR